MTLMADWTDGPEYAPSARPDASCPRRSSRSVDAGAPPTAERAPAEQPEFTGSADAVLPERLVASSGPERDPLEMFTVVTTPLATLPDVPSQPGATQRRWRCRPRRATATSTPRPSWALRRGSCGFTPRPVQPRTYDGWRPRRFPTFPLPSRCRGYPQHLAVNPQGFTGADATWYGANPGYTGRCCR